MTKQIPLTQGKVAIVDDDDFETLSVHKWCVNNYGYAVRRSKVINGQSKILLMHRVIMDAPSGMEVDHKNMNPLDNRKSNLRICSSSQNKHNKVPQVDNTTGYKGVSKRVDTGKYRAYIFVNGKQLTLGNYISAEQAARAYDAAAKKYFGEFAHPNFPDEEIDGQFDQAINE